MSRKICPWLTLVLLLSPMVEGALRETISLDGTWDFLPDPEDKGKRERWFAQWPKKRQFIRVPSCWEEYAAPGYDGVAWYWTTFLVPARWQGKVVRLRFGAVNNLCEVWVNGEFVGRHENGYTPFEFEVSHLLHYGTSNRLAVRVVDTLTGLAVSKETWYYNYAGVWQGVELLATAPTYLADVFVEPKNTGEVTAHLTVMASREEQKVRLIVSASPVWPEAAGEPAARAQRTLALKAGPQRVKVSLQVPEPLLWSPETPHLYALRVQLASQEQPRGEEEVTAYGYLPLPLYDEVTVRFGFREFTVREGDFYLNGQRIILKGTLLQPNYAQTFVYPESKEFARREVQMHKEAGFNCLRSHLKPAHPWTLQAADELGLLIYEEPAIGWMSLPREEDAQAHNLSREELLWERAASEVREMIQRDRNHPCIVLWGILHEGGGATGPLQERLVQLARKLDPTRLILDEAALGLPRHQFQLPHAPEPVKHWHKHPSGRCPVSERTFEEFRTFGRADQAALVSLYGYRGLSDLSAVVAEYQRRRAHPQADDFAEYRRYLHSAERGFHRYGLDQLFPDLSALFRATQEVQAAGDRVQMEALRINPHLDGYFVSPWNDASWEMSGGLVDPWRRPKSAYKMLRQVNAPTYLVLRASPHNLGVGEKVNLRAWLVEEGTEGTPRQGTFGVQIEGPEGKVAFAQEVPVELTPPLSELPAQTPLLSAEGRYTVRAAVKVGGEEIARNETEVLVLARRPGLVVEGWLRIAALGPSREEQDWLEAQGVQLVRYTPYGETTQAIFLFDPRALRPRPLTQYQALFDTVAAGSTAAFLRLPSPPLVEHLFPVPFTMRGAMGPLVGVYHYRLEHPLFRGTPGPGILGLDWANLLPNQGLVFPPAVVSELEIPVGAFSPDRQEKVFWWAADLAVMPYGKGQIILSTLNLPNQLGRDPLADRVLGNLLSYAAQRAGQPADFAREPTERERAYHARLRQLRERGLLAAPALWTAQASHREGPEERAFDRLPETRWSTGTPMQPGMWFQVDFGDPVRFNEIILDSQRSPHDWPRGLKVEVSLDGEDWQQVAFFEDVSSHQRNGVFTVQFEPVTARFLRLTQTGQSERWYWSIHELLVRLSE